MTPITFTVQGNPVAKQSFKMGANGHGYQPERVTNWEQTVAWAAVEAMTGRPPFDGPVYMVVDFHLESKRRVDLDNLQKAVADGCAQGGLFTDDRWIHDLHIRKHYTAKGQGHVDVEVGVLA